MTTFEQLGLAKRVLRALADRGYDTPTQIQSAAIPSLLQGRDMLGVAQTGTGKTAAFALPMVHALCQDRVRKGFRRPRGLVLAPTRELASQIADEIRAFSRYTDLKHTVIFGGVNQGRQVADLRRGVDIVIATPGRLMDLMNQGQVSLQDIKHAVLDEADRMLDMGFVHDMRRILGETPTARQTMLFSATLSKEVGALVSDFLNEPERISVAPQATPIDRIEQAVHHLETKAKTDLLIELSTAEAVTRAIVFVRTKHRADRLAKRLDKAGIGAEALHGDKSQGARQRALKSFRDGKARVMIATDIAARGIDVDNVSHVFNFELPNEAETYVHRIGRTARAGAEGQAVSFCDPTERGYLRAIEKLIRMKLTVVGAEPAGPAREPKPRRGQKSSAPRPRRRQTSVPAESRDSRIARLNHGFADETPEVREAAATEPKREAAEPVQDGAKPRRRPARGHAGKNAPKPHRKGRNGAGSATAKGGKKGRKNNQARDHRNRRGAA
ncbi:MAG: DEAD/DEAH box helicase [Alphaproteobacteria bacterium]|nr:DEAD/DEAH box helicase [Alphaproteobacteria bacterium]